MPELQFSAEAVRTAGGDLPALSVQLEITNSGGERVQSVALTVQVQVEPARRSYSDAEKEALNDLFGEPERWRSTVRPLIWTVVNVTVPGFSEKTSFELVVPTASDPRSAVAKYLGALESGEVPLSLLFSGRVLCVEDAGVQMFPIPWSLETACRIPAEVREQIVARDRPQQVERGAAWM